MSFSLQFEVRVNRKGGCIWECGCIGWRAIVVQSVEEGPIRTMIVDFSMMCVRFGGEMKLQANDFDAAKR